MKTKLCMTLVLSFFSTAFISQAFSADDQLELSGKPGQQIPQIALADEGLRFSAAEAYNIINQNSNLCLAIADGSYAESAMVIQTADCQNVSAQWNPVDRGNGWYSVRNNKSGLCLAIRDGSGQIGAPAVQISNCDSTAAQWVAVWYQAYIRFYVRHSGLCLEIDDGSASDGALAVQTNACASRPAQWYIKDLRG